MNYSTYKNGNEINYRFDCFIIPKRIVERNKIYKILYVPKTFIINNFLLITKNNRLKELVIENSFHPNASYNLDNPEYNHKLIKKDTPPNRQYFCLPDNLKNIEIDEDKLKYIYPMIVSMINTYHNDSCFYTTWRLVKWIKEEDYIQEIEDKPKLIHKIIAKVLDFWR